MSGWSGAADTSAFSATVIPMNRARGRSGAIDQAVAWRDTVIARLDYLCQMKPGWDGYRARPVSFRIAKFTFDMLESFMNDQTPLPSIVPGPCGDLQVEWHLKAGDIELHVKAPLDVVCWRETSETGDQGEELRLTSDFRTIARWIDDLGVSKRANNASAA